MKLDYLVTSATSCGLQCQCYYFRSRLDRQGVTRADRHCFADHFVASAKTLKGDAATADVTVRDFFNFRTCSRCATHSPISQFRYPPTLPPSPPPNAPRKKKKKMATFRIPPAVVSLTDGA